MDVRIIDRDRNVTATPLHGALTNPDANYIAIMETLMRHMPIHTGRVEFECDQEFRDALDAQAADRPEPDYGFLPQGEATPDAFHNVPILIVETQP